MKLINIQEAMESFAFPIKIYVSNIQWLQCLLSPLFVPPAISYEWQIGSFLQVKVLGPTFVQQEAMDVGKAYAETSSATPLIFIVGEEVDPCKYIFR